MPYLGMESNSKVHQWYLFGSNKRKDCEELYLDMMRLNVQCKKSSIGEYKMTHVDKQSSKMVGSVLAWVKSQGYARPFHRNITSCAQKFLMKYCQEKTSLCHRMNTWLDHILNPEYFFNSNFDLLGQGHSQECIKDGKRYRTSVDKGPHEQPTAALQPGNVIMYRDYSGDLQTHEQV